MATYYDGLNDFYKLNELNPLQSSAQLVYLHLLHLNNRLGNSGTVQVSDRELGLRTSLSKQTITEAKRTLKNRGLIDFKTDRDKPHKGTTYTLTFFATVGQTVGQRLGQTVGQTVGQPALVSYTLAREDPRLETDCSVGQSARTRDTKKEEVTLSNRDTQASETEPIDELVDYWERTLRGGRMTAEHQSELFIYLKDPEKGFAWVKEAMKEASDANSNPHGLSFKLLRGVMEKKAKPKNQTRQPVLKGSERDERKQESDGYEIPVDTGDEPWNKY